MKKKISNNRLLEQRDGFQVITPNIIGEIIPLFCPHCKRILSGQEDVNSYKEFKCCECCDIHWARPNLEKWKSGWRPARDKVEQKIAEKMLDIINVLT